MPADLVVLGIPFNGDGTPPDVPSRLPSTVATRTPASSMPRPGRMSPGARSTAIPRLDGLEVRRRGAEAAARWCLEALSRRPAVWLHLDVDVLDPSVMPVLFPEADGLTPEDLGGLLGAILRSGRVVGLDVARYHPALDPGLTAARRLVRLLAESLESAP
jgi:arginase family enzyme